jgi:hypothetical protein
MLDTQPGSSCDRGDYRPPGCDVARPDPIGVRGKTAPSADERRLRAAVRLVNAATFRARSARVARVHNYNRNAGKRRLVGEKQTQLEERPGVQSASLSFSNRYPVANTAEVFHSDTATGVSSFANDLLRKNVVRVRMEVALLRTKLPQMAFGALRPGALESGTKLRDAASQSERALTGMRFAVRVDREVADAEIDAEPAFGVNRTAVGDVDGHVQVELPLAVNEVSLTANTVESTSVVSANGTRDDDTAVEGQQTYAIEAVLETVDPLIVSDGAVFSKVNQLHLVPLVNFADFRDGAHGVLRGETESIAQVAVVELLELQLVGTLQLESALGKPGTGFVHASHRRKQSSFLGRVDEQLHCCDQLHAYSANTTMENVNQEPEQHSLPCLAGAEARASVLEI